MGIREIWDERKQIPRCARDDKVKTRRRDKNVRATRSSEASHRCADKTVCTYTKQIVKERSQALFRANTSMEDGEGGSDRSEKFLFCLNGRLWKEIVIWGALTRHALPLGVRRTVGGRELRSGVDVGDAGRTLVHAEQHVFLHGLPGVARVRHGIHRNLLQVAGVDEVLQ